ncbi:class I SAM-dependent methyltransferase [Skermania piniformis]|uniref:Methyltransferase domain-containing protein n=1 Tax=Skermania pinensis TaxID=39122 RepID=A0ABX8SBG9_9ACTN|nr:methyltransferase domain-containing protein [Skermania piniformis]QXQ14327.1 methyltransferase domain-containing protein [Skermania piniformis]
MAEPTARATTRALLNRPAVDRNGYLDVLGREIAAPTPTPAQRAMNAPLVATVYERIWRPAAFFGASGVRTETEWRRTLRRLRPAGADRVLDVACGPGLFTSRLAERLGPDGLAVGLDISAPMLHRAVHDNAGPQTCYVRGDAGTLPFDDATFDVVCCLGALYLVPEPDRVVDEMIRVLAPGGRIAILTTYANPTDPVRRLIGQLGDRIGVRGFDRARFPSRFAAAELTDIRQQIHGLFQFVAADAPGEQPAAERRAPQ